MSTTAPQPHDDREITQILSSIRRMIVDDLTPHGKSKPVVSGGETVRSSSRMDGGSSASGQADALPLTRLLRDDGSVVTLPLPHHGGVDSVPSEDGPRLHQGVLSDEGPVTHQEPRVFYGFKPNDMSVPSAQTPSNQDASYPWPTHDDGTAAVLGHDSSVFDAAHGSDVPSDDGACVPSDAQWGDDFGPELPPPHHGGEASHTLGAEREGGDDRHAPSALFAVAGDHDDGLRNDGPSDIWIDGSVQAQTQQALDGLLLAQQQASDPLSGTLGSAGHRGESPTLDGFIRDLLKPMMKDWLDRHLPDIVERQVRLQIDAIMRQKQ